MKLSDIIKSQGDFEILSFEETGKAVRALLPINEGKLARSIEVKYVEGTGIVAFKKVNLDYKYTSDTDLKVKKSAEVLGLLGIQFEYVRYVRYNERNGIESYNSGVSINIPPFIRLASFKKSDRLEDWCALQKSFDRKWKEE